LNLNLPRPSLCVRDIIPMHASLVCACVCVYVGVCPGYQNAGKYTPIYVHTDNLT